MKNIGIICEGPTDYIILKNVINLITGDTNYFVLLQPEPHPQWETFSFLDTSPSI